MFQCHTTSSVTMLVLFQLKFLKLLQNMNLVYV